MNIGDSSRESDIGVAPGFPNDSLSSDEIIIPSSFSRYFGFISDDGGEVVTKKEQKLNLTFNLLDLLSNDKNLKKFTEDVIEGNTH